MSIAATPTASAAPLFVDRRGRDVAGETRDERRQFGNSHTDLSPEALELALAIDRYKIANRRRYITCDEMLAVVKQLGYQRASS